MVGLHLLKHMDGLSDEAVCARYLDSPYVQLFCGEAYFQHALPLDRSSMTRWRQRIGAERLEVLLAESLAAAQRGGAVEEQHLRRVTIDTTVQPKAVTHPTDSKLLHRGIEILARLARRHGMTAAPVLPAGGQAGEARGREADLLGPPSPGRAAGSAAAHLARAPGPRHRPQDRRQRGHAGGLRRPARRLSAACCGSGARTAAATSSTPCTRRRWSASARARRRPATSSA